MQIQERILQLMKNSSDALSLTFAEFCHIRNVITRAELETLLFDDKLYNEVAQSKLCFNCRKVRFNLLTFTFGVQCNVCKQKVCRNCLTRIALPKAKFNDLPIQTLTPLTLTKSLSNSDRYHSSASPSPMTPMMNDVVNDENEYHRCSTPNQWPTALINICTDCFFLLQQIRKKSRQRHVTPTVTSNLVSSTSSLLLNRARYSASNHNLSTSSSTSSIAALLAQQQQRTLMVKTTSIHSNLKQTKSVQNLSTIEDSLSPATIVAPTERVRLARHHLFLQLQPVYDLNVNPVQTE